MIRSLILIILLNYVYLIVAICPDGTLPSLINPTLCYKFISEAAVFTESEAACQQGYGGHLASVTDGFTNTFLAREF